MTILDLFLTFAKIGLFTFGGGYAMIALIEDICVEKKQWITPDEMMNVTVIAESTPGPIAINCATYVGYKKKGLSGAAVATIGMVLPSFCIIFLISMFLDNFLDITWIAHAFMGIKVAVGTADAPLASLHGFRRKAAKFKPAASRLELLVAEDYGEGMAAIPVAEVEAALDRLIRPNTETD